MKTQFSLQHTKLVSFLLVLFCIQIVPLEGYGTSLVKVAVMCLMPFLIIRLTPNRTKAMTWGMLLIITMCVCAFMQSSVRIATICYFILFVITYILFYGLVYKGAVNLDFYMRFAKKFIFAFWVILVLQQLFVLAGIHYFPFINLSNQHFLSITKLPSLTLEPSHTARVLGVLFFSYIFCVQLKNNSIITLKDLINPAHRKVTFAFLWTMLTMGSGTAFVMIAIILLFFLRSKNFIYIVPFFLVVVAVVVYSNVEQIQRILFLIEAMKTNDATEILTADSSGAARILPFFNTIQEFDLTSKNFLFGSGTIMEEYEAAKWKEYLMTQKISTIEQYGFVTWIVSLLFVFKCAIRKFFCVETIVFIVALGFNLGNIAYVWGILMMFTMIKYFEKNKNII